MPVGGLASCDYVRMFLFNPVIWFHGYIKFSTTLTNINQPRFRNQHGKPKSSQSYGPYLSCPHDPLTAHLRISFTKARTRSPPGRRECLTTTCSSRRPQDTSAEYPWCRLSLSTQMWTQGSTWLRRAQFRGDSRWWLGGIHGSWYYQLRNSRRSWSGMEDGDAKRGTTMNVGWTKLRYSFWKLHRDQSSCREEVNIPSQWPFSGT